MNDSIKNLYGNLINRETLEESLWMEEVFIFLDMLLIEFDKGKFLFIFLENKGIEYSLEFRYLNKNSVLIPNRNLKIKSTYFSILNKKEISDMDFIHSVKGKEVTCKLDGIGDELLYSRLGIVLTFENDDKFFIFSGELEKIDNSSFRITRPDSIISCVYVEKNGKLQLKSKSKGDSYFTISDLNLD